MGALIEAQREGPDQPWFIIGEGGRKTEFKEILGAFGFGDPRGDGEFALNAFTVVGLSTSGLYMICGDPVGSFEAVAKAAIDFKDRFLLETLLIDPASEEFQRRLNDQDEFDGLTDYATRGKGPGGRWEYKHEPPYWPNFRSYFIRPALVEVREEILKDFRSASLEFHGLTAADKVRSTPECTKAGLFVREGFRRGHEHPLWKALVYGTLELRYRHQGSSGTAETEDEPKTWYRGGRT